MTIDDQIKDEKLQYDINGGAAKISMHKIKMYENKVIRDNLFYESSKQIYDFKVLKTVRYFGDIYRNTRN